MNQVFSTPTSPTVASRTSLGKTGLLLFGIAASLGLATAPVSAFSLTSRTSNYGISFTDPTFADANAIYNAQAIVTADPGDVTSLNVEVKTNAQGYGFTTFGSNIITNSSQSGSTYSYDLGSTGGAGGYQWGYNTPVATTPMGSFAESWLVRSPNGSAWDLEFLGGGTSSGSIDANAVFEVVIAINGNWSSLGMGPGQTEFKGIGAGYSILDNFIYDSVTNQTRFRATKQGWDGSSPEVNFVLHSSTNAAAIPEPVTILGAVSGGVGCFLLRRRQRLTKK